MIWKYLLYISIFFLLPTGFDAKMLRKPLVPDPGGKPMSTAAATGTSTLRKESYIPGFDWVRLVGSCLVVVSHCGFFDRFIKSATTVYLLFSNLVPVFFLMAGWLIAEKLDDRDYVARYVKKYGGIYLAVCLLRIGLYVANHLLILRDLDLLNVLKALTFLPFNCAFDLTLWFVPALIYGVLVCAMLRRRPKLMLVLCVLCAAVIVFHTLTGRFTGKYPARGIARGILYVYLGVRRREKTFPLWPIAAAAAILAAFELLVCCLDLAAIPLSLLVFEGILRLKGGFLYSYHRQISIFSMLNYFLHRLEQLLLNYFIPLSHLGVLLVILAANALLTAPLCSFLRRAQQRKHANGL